MTNLGSLIFVLLEKVGSLIHAVIIVVIIITKPQPIQQIVFYQELTGQYYYYTLGLNLSITVHIDFTAISLWLNQQFAFSNYYSLCPIFWSGFCENGKAFVFPCTAILLMIILLLSMHLQIAFLKTQESKSLQFW